jgi:hypothetical protein
VLNERLRAAIEELPGIDPSGGLEVLQCSSAHSSGAIIFHVRAGRSRQLDAIIKTPRDPSSNHAIEIEWNNVTSLADDPKIRRLLPSPLRRFEVDGARFYAYGGIAGKTMFARFRDRIFTSRDRMRIEFASQAVGAAIGLHESSSRIEAGDSLANDLDESFRALERLVGAIPSVATRHIEEARDFLAASKIRMPVGRIHGDFSPYNLMIAGRGSRACSGIIDWEHYERDRPQHIDIFRFIGSCELMGRLCVENAATLRRMSKLDNPAARVLLTPWIRRMVPSPDAIVEPRAYAALWTHYWVTAAYREQERQPDPTNITRSTYLPGLFELLAV